MSAERLFEDFSDIPKLYFPKAMLYVPQTFVIT